MNSLPKCPACREGDLLLRDEVRDGQWHYHVECAACGIEFHHESFYGYNMVMGFFENECAPTVCENEATFAEDGEQLEWKCSVCGKERVCAEGEPAYKFCPDCGAEVLEW